MRVNKAATQEEDGPLNPFVMVTVCAHLRARIRGQWPGCQGREKLVLDGLRFFLKKEDFIIFKAITSN
jgi:hypothetical protein